MRWEFPDPSDLDESRARQPITEAMDRWWDAFASRADELDDAFSRDPNASIDIPEFTNTHLKPIHPGLCWEYGRAVTKQGHRLVITPESRRELKPMVRELLRRAPDLPRWEFYPSRLPDDPKIAFMVAEQLARFKPTSVMVKASLGRFRRIDLEYHVPDAKRDERAATHYVFRATEQMLGEEVLDHWLGVIELAPQPSMLKRALGGARVPGLVTPDRLKPTVDALIAASLEQLPDPPMRAQPDKDQVTWYSFKMDPPATNQDDYPGRSDMFVAITCEPDIVQAGFADPIFHSGRFSRSGETFCYLKLDRRAGADGSKGIETVDDRASIEDAINAVLAEHGLGCSIGGGTGLLYAYIDLAIRDVQKVIPVLRDLLQRRRVNPRSWLLFLDPELSDEWVGVYEHTPPPPAAPEESK